MTASTGMMARTRQKTAAKTWRFGCEARTAGDMIREQIRVRLEMMAGWRFVSALRPRRHATCNIIIHIDIKLHVWCVKSPKRASIRVTLTPRRDETCKSIPCGLAPNCPRVPPPAIPLETHVTRANPSRASAKAHTEAHPRSHHTETPET